MLATDAVMTVIDFEATGSVDGHANEPWQIGTIRFAGGRPTADAAFESLLRVGDRPFSPHAPGRHALLRDALRIAPRLRELWPDLRSRILGVPLVAHHVSTEKRFLAEAFPLQSLGPWIDTLKLARLAFPHLPSHKLSDLLTVFGLEERVERIVPGRAPHDALYDAVGSAVLLERLLSLPEWNGVSVAALARAHPARYHRLRVPHGVG